MEVIFSIVFVLAGFWLWWKIFQYVLIPLFRPVLAFFWWLGGIAVSVGLFLWTASDFVLLFSAASPVGVFLLLIVGGFFLVRKLRR